MATNSKIEWTHHTMNPWRGCSRASAGCDNCYAEAMSKRNPGTLGIWGPEGTRVVASEAQWKLPHKWNREAEAAGERRRVFCASLADVFEDWDGPVVDSRGVKLWQTWDSGRVIAADVRPVPRSSPLRMHDIRQRLFSVIDETPWLDWLLLTKRPENARRMMATAMGYSERMVGFEIDIEEHIERCLPNLWIGTSVENQEQADKRIPELLRVPAAIRFLSMEPLLGPVADHGNPLFPGDPSMARGWSWGDIDWVIVGGESGPSARPCDLEWIRSIREQCKEAGVPVFVKQLGAEPYLGFSPLPSGMRVRKENHAFLDLRDKKGGDLSEWPEDLRVRELPTTTVLTGD